MIEKVYITRDTLDTEIIVVWRKPHKGNWSPKSKSKELINYQRDDRSLEGTSFYTVTTFKKKFNTTIRAGTKKLIGLPKELLDTKEGQLFTT